MHTLKKFVKYYAPYRTVFFLDLICAAIISLVDLAFPQILRTLTKTLFTEDPSQILGALLPIGLALLVMYIIQTFCKYYVSYQGHMMGHIWNGICARSYLIIMRDFLFLIMTRIIPDR